MLTLHLVVRILSEFSLQIVYNFLPLALFLFLPHLRCQLSKIYNIYLLLYIQLVPISLYLHFVCIIQKLHLNKLQIFLSFYLVFEVLNTLQKDNHLLQALLLVFYYLYLLLHRIVLLFLFLEMVCRFHLQYIRHKPTNQKCHAHYFRF